MSVKIILLILSFVIFYSSYSQILLCTYRNDSSYGYTCDIFIYNPTGAYNFSRVSGTHLANKTNQDVRRIVRTIDSNTTNVPYIICETFQNATRLELQSIKISKLDVNAFWGCKMLKFLDLSYNSLTTFPAFSNYIQATNTHILELPWDNYDLHLQSLETLYLQNNQIEKIEPKTFNSLTNLLKLYLYSNKITKIVPESFESLQLLENLNLGSNQLTEILPEYFGPLFNLQTLNLNGNQIAEILPKTFSQLVNLKILYLSTNHIEEIPSKTFSTLVNLNTLSLSYNNISKIYVDSFESLKNLTELYLHNNQIEELPRNFLSSLKQLPIINLYNNKLKIVHSFGLLPKLVTVNLFNNQIDAFDQDFIDDTAVKTLDMRNNSCVNSSITDLTQSRMQMRLQLLKCFENYANIEVGTTTIPTTVSTTTESTTTAITLPPGCIEGRLDERVCRLEDKNEEFEENFYNFFNNEMQENFKNHSTAIEELQKKIEELTNRPCACN